MPVEHVTSILDEWEVYGRKVRRYRDYDRGRHELRFATPDFVAKYGSLILDEDGCVRENLIPVVISAPVDRIAVDSWGSADALDETQRRGVDRLLERVTRESFRCGEASVLVWPGADGRPRPHYHQAGAIMPHRSPDDPDVLDRAVKLWVDASGYGRANVYYADVCERWVTLGKVRPVEKDAAPQWPRNSLMWAPFEGDGDPATISHDFGAVPVCWFPRMVDDDTGHGTSIVADAIPIQDALNKSLADLIVTSEGYARPFWYLLNHTPDADVENPFLPRVLASPADMRGDFDPTRQRIFAYDGNGPFGQLEPPDLTRLLAVQDGFALKMARVVGIPSYYLTQTSGNVPSGEALRVLTSRLVSIVTSYEATVEPVWRGLLDLLGTPVDAIQWAEPIPMDPVERWQVAQIKQSLGYALEDIIRDAGEADVDGVVTRAAQASAENAARMARAFMAGEGAANYGG